MQNAPRWPLPSHSLWRLVVASILTTLAIVGCGNDRPNATAGATGTGGGGGTTGATCTQEGAVQPCHEKLGQHGNIVTCIDGEQYCYGGHWTACQSTQGDVLVRSVDLGAQGMLHLQTVAPGGTTCTSDPCDPDCQASTVTGPYTASAAVSGTVIGVSGGYIANSNIPGNCSSSNGGATAYGCSGFKAKTTDPDAICGQCTSKNVPISASVTQQACQSACQSDQHCTGDGTNSCTAFAPQDDNWECATKPDVTVPLACQNSSGQEQISVCNRGGVDLPAGIECCRFPGNSPHFADDLASTAASCAGGDLLGTTTGVIAPHHCEVMNVNPSGNTGSIICNPHYTQSSGTSTVTATASAPTGTSGGWTTVRNIWDNTANTNGTASLGQQTATSTFGTATQTAGTWVNTANAQATSADNVFATTAVGAGAATADGYKLPTSYTAVSPVGWSNAANALSASDGSAVASAATDGVQTLQATGYSTSGLSNSAGTGGFLGWRNVGSVTGTTPTNLYDGTSNTFSETEPGKSGESQIVLTGYTGLPPGTATSLAVAATWKADVTNGDCTVKIWLRDYTDGSNVLGNNHYLYNQKFRPTAANTVQTDTITLSASELASVNASANFLAQPQVFVDVTCPNGGGTTLQAIAVDSINLLTKYPLVDTFGTFNFGTSEGGTLPATATVTEIDYKAVYRMTGSTTTSSSVSFAAYVGSSTAPGTSTKQFLNNPLGTVPSALTTVTWSDTGLSLSASSLSNANFAVRVTAAGGGTAELESLQVQLRYVNGASNVLTLTNFGFNVPTTATITSVVANTKWKTDTANGTLGMQLYDDSGNALGTETTISPGPTSSTSATQIYNGTLTPAQVNSSNFGVHVRASGTGTAFNASFDYVSVTVTYVVTSASVDLTGFGFAIPATASITSLTLSMKEKVSSSSPSVDIKAEAFKTGAVSFGAVAEDTNPGTNYSTVSGSAPGGSLGAPADYNSGFFVRLTATTPSSTSVNFNALVDSISATVTYSGAGVAKGVDECDPYNNWTAYKSGDACVNLTLPGVYASNVLTYEYTPVCPNGTRIQWNYLTWDAQTPTYTSGGTTYNSSITFAATTTRLTPTAGATTSYGTIASTPPSPATCPVSGVSGCPIDLFSAFGGIPKAQDDKLTLTITINPTCDITASPCTGSVTPTLNSWNITYDCVGAE